MPQKQPEKNKEALVNAFNRALAFANNTKNSAQKWTFQQADKLGVKSKLEHLTNQIVIPERVKNATQKELMVFGFCLAACLYMENVTSLPFLSGPVQLAATILATMAYLINTIANLNDPLGTPLSLDAMLIVGGHMLYKNFSPSNEDLPLAYQRVGSDEESASPTPSQ